jgi:transposase-like protein
VGKTPCPLPKCSSLDTKRNGKPRAAPVGQGRPLQPLQRFWCNACRTPFTHARRKAQPGARFADDVVEGAVRVYVHGLSSYRVLATMLEHRLGEPVSRFTLNIWVQKLGAEAKTPLEVSVELSPKWGGFLGVDGKAICVGGAKHCLLIGVDHPTQDLVHALVLDSETADGFARLVTEARLDAGYPLNRVVADLGPGFPQAHRDHFGTVPFQACRVHFDRRLDTNIPKAKWSKKAPLYQELKDRILGSAVR